MGRWQVWEEGRAGREDPSCPARRGTARPDMSHRSHIVRTRVRYVEPLKAHDGEHVWFAWRRTEQTT